MGPPRMSGASPGELSSCNRTSDVDDVEPQPRGVAEARNVAPVAGHDPSSASDGDGDHRCVDDIDCATPAEKSPDGMSHRLIQGNDLAPPQQAPKVRLARRPA